MDYKLGDCLMHIQLKQVARIIEVIEFVDGQIKYIVEFVNNVDYCPVSDYSHNREKRYTSAQLQRKFTKSEAAWVLYGSSERGQNGQH